MCTKEDRTPNGKEEHCIENFTTLKIKAASK